MRRLSRHVGSTVLMAMVMVLCVIVGLDMLTALIDQLDKLRGNYTFVAALEYVLLTVPGRVHEYLPFAALVGCLAGLGSLASNSELVVMQAAGVSRRRLVWLVLRPTLALAFAGLLVGEYISPLMQQIAESHRAVALQQDTRIHSEAGMWHKEGRRFMHFNAVQPNGVIYGVSVYTLGEDQQLVSSLHADRASYMQGRWLFENVKESTFSEAGASRNELAQQAWDTGLTPELLNLLVLRPDDLALTGAWRYVQYLTDQGINSDEYRLAFWSKVLQPLTIVGLVLIAISFIFGPLRQVTMGFRIFIGVMLGVAFQTLQSMLAPASMVLGFPPVLAVLLPVVLSAGIGLWLLRR